MCCRRDFYIDFLFPGKNKSLAEMRAAGRRQKETSPGVMLPSQCLPSLCNVAGGDRSCRDGSSESLQERKVTERECHKADNEKVERNRETDRNGEKREAVVFQKVRTCASTVRKMEKESEERESEAAGEKARDAVFFPFCDPKSLHASLYNSSQRI